LRDAIALRPPRAAADDAILVGWTDTADASLVPAATIKALGDPAPQRVRLGNLAAFGYGPASASGSEFTVYAVPTSEGVVTVTCRSQAPGEVSRSCDGIAGSLRLGRGARYDLPPRAQFARDVDAVVNRMSRDEKAAGRELSNARRARSQARALRRLAAVYGSAANSLQRVPTAPFEAPASQSLVAYLQRLQRETRALADAASGGYPKRYAQRRTTVRRLRAGLPERIEAVAPTHTKEADK
jgi:hypothetical protein